MISITAFTLSTPPPPPTHTLAPFNIDATVKKIHDVYFGLNKVVICTDYTTGKGKITQAKHQSM